MRRRRARLRARVRHGARELVRRDWLGSRPPHRDAPRRRRQPRYRGRGARSWQRRRRRQRGRSRRRRRRRGSRDRRRNVLLDGDPLRAGNVFACRVRARGKPRQDAAAERVHENGGRQGDEQRAPAAAGACGEELQSRARIGHGRPAIIRANPRMTRRRSPALRLALAPGRAGVPVKQRVVDLDVREFRRGERLALAASRYCGLPGTRRIGRHAEPAATILGALCIASTSTQPVASGRTHAERAAAPRVTRSAPEPRAYASAS